MTGRGRERRLSQRYPTKLHVRFGSAIEFVTEYADNLSRNGLFIRGEGQLEALSEAQVEISLPGHGTVKVGVRIARIVTREMAAMTGAPVGVGVEIIEAPASFHAVLDDYLRRLGSRRDHTILCHDDEPRAYFERMGYVARAMPGMGELMAEIARAAHPVIAVVVPRAAERLFRRLLEPGGAGDLLHVAGEPDELDAVLTALDLQL